MNNYKQHLTRLCVIMALLLTLLPLRPAYASLIDELTPLPVQAGWNPSIWIFRQMHASPDGRYFSYIEYKGEPAEVGSPEYSEEKNITYRNVVFDRVNEVAHYSPEISLYSSVHYISAFQIFGGINNSGVLVYSVPNGTSIAPGIYKFTPENGAVESILTGYTALLSISDNGRYALLTKQQEFGGWISGVPIVYDFQQGLELDMTFALGLSLSASSSLNISDNALFVMENNEETFSEAIIDPVSQTIVNLTETLSLGDIGSGILITPDGSRFLTRQRTDKTIIFGRTDDYSFVTYTLSQLGVENVSAGYPLDITNTAFGLAASTGIATDGIISYAVSDNVLQGSVYREFNLTTGQLLQESLIATANGNTGYFPMVTTGFGGGKFFIGSQINEDGVPNNFSYYYWKNGAKAQALKIEGQSNVIDTYYSPQFSVDIKTLGEHYAVDANCTLNGPAALASASYGNWGSANRLQLPLQWQGQSLNGALSQTAPDAAVDGEQMLFNTVVLAEMTTDTLTINCSGDMSDASGHLLSVMPDTITITLDDGIHGGNSAVNGQIVLPGGVSAEDVVVNITIDGRTVSVTPDENGNFSFSGLRAGDFTVDFQSEGYVQSCMNATLDGAGNHDFGQIELLAGDINQDGAIDIADFTFLSGRYGTQQGEENYVATADLNKDTVINVQDLAILASHFGSQQCNP